MCERDFDEFTAWLQSGTRSSASRTSAKSLSMSTPVPSSVVKPPPGKHQLLGSQMFFAELQKKKAEKVHRHHIAFSLLSVFRMTLGTGSLLHHVSKAFGVDTLPKMLLEKV